MSNLRGIFSDLRPIITILSTIIGIFLIFVLIESPLSPLPVPPLPYPPVGPYPPTNIYPFGIPPGRGTYGMQYAGPSAYGGYRIPRSMEMSNMTEVIEMWFQKVMDKVAPSFTDDYFISKDSWTQQLTDSVKSYFSSFSTFMDQKYDDFLHAITNYGSGDNNESIKTGIKHPLLSKLRG